MLGAIVGDYVGSVYEHEATKTKDVLLLDPRATVTDDSLLTVAVAEWILDDVDLVDRFHEMVRLYPGAGWGGMFYHWASARRREAYNSFGNGAAMRASPVGWAYDTLDATLAAAAQSAAVTHDHPEGIKGAQATAAAVFLARTTHDRDAVRREITERFGYDLSRSLDQIRPTYAFDESCQRTVPQALVAFLEAADYEDAVRNAISLGGDADTLACIAGGIAHACFGSIPAPLAAAALASLPAPLRETWHRFQARYRVPA